MGCTSWQHHRLADAASAHLLHRYRGRLRRSAVFRELIRVHPKTILGVREHHQKGIPMRREPRERYAVP